MVNAFGMPKLKSLTWFPFVYLLRLQGDNQNRLSGQALEFKQLNVHAWEAFEKGQDIHLQAAPSQAELLYKNYNVIKEKLKSRLKDIIAEKYGNAASEEEIPRELLLGQSERQVEYDRAGRIIQGVVMSSKVELWLYILQLLVFSGPYLLVQIVICLSSLA